MSQAVWTPAQIEPQQGRVILVTGATSGIGLETARVLAAKGADVIIGARNIPKAEGVIAKIKAQHANAKLHLYPLDLTSLTSVANFTQQVTTHFERLDVLINNAGIMACPEGRTEDGFELQFGTNHLGHFAMTMGLLPLIKSTEGARVVVLSSLAHYFGKLDLSDLNWRARKYNKNRAYGDSKLSNLYFAYELDRRFKAEGIDVRVTAAHPGWTATELQRHTGLVERLNGWFAQGVEMGAQPTLRAGFDDSAQSGDFFGPSKHFELHGAPVRVSSNKRSMDRNVAQQLWLQSEQLTGCYYQ
ncbi:oxidoreductase [Ferrimonas aestuarii]|uniref:SDR family NAD(P)-dependent oxidoreductase n=1 Tax=Ferrimonas aestuarii TaxID=2569539 RepID=A0A4U1BKR3_9GAMM|nr:oxidoreductase [Ferrimonas aestuarii]TKB51850.1 SDR family NAD(P)-dependent oxidoreductase [Ferrimonas aestuarii]